MYSRVLSFLMVLVVLSVLVFFFSCSLSPSPSATNEVTNEGSGGSVADTNKPSVSITTPTNGQVLYDNRITVSGTASDEGSGVKEVWLSVNGGAYGKVNGTTSWSTNVTVNYGNNTIRVYAVDNSNNVSTTNTVSVFRDYVVFVSTVGSDANTGGISDPFRSINVAMGHISASITASVTVTVKVGSGVYTPGSGLSSSGSGFVINRPNVIISGGWNSGFSNVVGESELDGNNDLYHVVMIKDVTNVRLENLVIRGGNANGSDPDDSGGGIYVSRVSYLVIESNVVISNNSASWNGGGLYLDRSTNTTISGSVYSNSANNNGGGLYLYYSQNTTISGSVYGNSANNNGGGLFLLYSPNTTISSSVYSNRANYRGGGVYLLNSDYFTNTGWITNNTAGSAGAGGGVHRIGSYPNSYFGNVSGNFPNNIAP